MADAPAPPSDDALPPYQGLTLAEVRMVRTPDDAAAALAAMAHADAIGFDTESKPTFRKGEVSTGPHLVQLADDRHAWLFQIASNASPAGADAAAESAPVAALRALLESPGVLKVGFGLGDDLRRLRAKLGIDAANVLDLATVLRRGERNAWGAKTAVERFFGQRLQKSRRITTTNWAMPRLNDKQILYAADDAHVALRIYRHWRAHVQVAPASASARAAKPAPAHTPVKPQD